MKDLLMTIFGSYPNDYQVPTCLRRLQGGTIVWIGWLIDRLLFK